MFCYLLLILVLNLQTVLIVKFNYINIAHLYLLFIKCILYKIYNGQTIRKDLLIVNAINKLKTIYKGSWSLIWDFIW